MHAPCSNCGRPAVEELECWRCDGHGTAGSGSILSIIIACPECVGAGKLPYCDKCVPKRKSELLRQQLKAGRRANGGGGGAGTEPAGGRTAAEHTTGTKPASVPLNSRDGSGTTNGPSPKDGSRGVGMGLPSHLFGVSPLKYPHPPSSPRDEPKAPRGRLQARPWPPATLRPPSRPRGPSPAGGPRNTSLRLLLTSSAERRHLAADRARLADTPCGSPRTDTRPVGRCFIIPAASLNRSALGSSEVLA